MGRGPDQTFFQRHTDTWKDTQHHWLSVKCKAKPQQDNHLTLVRMAIITMTANNKCCKSVSCSVTLDSFFATPWTVACQTPLSMGFSRQEYWSGLPFPSPGDLPDPGIRPGYPAWQADSLPFELLGKPSVGEDAEKREPLVHRGGTSRMWVGAATMENSMEVGQNTKNRTVWPGNFTSGYLRKQTLVWKSICTPSIHCSIGNSQ